MIFLAGEELPISDTVVCSYQVPMQMIHMPRKEELLGSNPAGRAFLSSRLPFFLLF